VAVFVCVFVVEVVVVGVPSVTVSIAEKARVVAVGVVATIIAVVSPAAVESCAFVFSALVINYCYYHQQIEYVFEPCLYLVIHSLT